MIRNATYADIPALVALGREMHATSIFSTFNYDEEKTSGLIRTLVDVHIGIAIVSETDGIIEGGFIGAVHEHYFGRDLQATDYALFLTMTARNGRLGLRLIDEYVTQALAKGAKQIMLANSTGYQADRVANIFESRGFKKLGYVFEYQKGHQ